MWALRFRTCWMWLPGGDLFEAGTSQRTGGVTLLKSRVTGVVDLGGVAASAGRRERARVRMGS